MNCRHCGAEFSQGSAFCPGCGEATRDPTAETVAISIAAMEDPLLVAVREAFVQYYEVEKELGRGGMAVVYKGKERGLEREVAIKVLPPEMALQGGTAERFKREARLAAALDHTNIIPVYRVGEEKGLHFMAMKFVRGRGLDSIIEQQGALPVPVVVRVLAAAAAGLAHAHEKSIIHRDVKGANILIENDGRVLVSDFGIARAMTETSLTASGMVVGTPNFMSPEQCGGSKVGPQSDQYSLGILAFQMLTAQLPFEADSIMEVIQHHYMTPPPDLREVREGVPDELLEVIYKALNKKPEDRFASTHDMVDALEAVPLTAEEKRESLATLKTLSHGDPVVKVRTGSLPPLSLTASISGQQAATAFTPTPKAAPKPAKKSRAGLLAAAAAIVVLGGAGGVYQFVLKPAPQAPGADSTAAAAAGQPATPPGGAAAPGATPGRPAPPGTQPGATQPPGARRPTTEPAQRPPTTQQTPPAAAPAPAPAAGGPPGLIIVSVPGCASAEISVDGRRLGAGRASGSFPAGMHTLRVTAEGSAPYSQSVTVTAGERASVVVSSVQCAAGP